MLEVPLSEAWSYTGCGWTFGFYGVIAGYPMQTVFRFSRYGAEFDNKKSPHNNLNLTILSGMALVRVRYVAIESQKLAPAPSGAELEL